MAPRDGFEPPAKRLTVACSTAELPGTTTAVLWQLYIITYKVQSPFSLGVTSRVAEDLPTIHMILWTVFSLCSFEKSFCNT